MTSSTKTPKHKPKPPPLTLHPNPHNWLLNPLAEFAAIATSPQSPLVQQTTCEGGVYDVTSRDQDSTSVSSLTPLTAGKVSFSCGEDSDLSSSGNSSCSLSASLWQRLMHGTSLPLDDIFYRGNSIGFPGKIANSAMCSTGGLERDGQTLSNEKNIPPALLTPLHDPKENEPEIPIDVITLENNSFVKATPWSSFYSDKAFSRCGIPCRELLLRDLCFPLSTSDEATTSSSEAEVPPTPESTRTVLFDLDSAAHALSTMAKRKQEHDRYNRKVKPNTVKRKGDTRTKKNRSEAVYAKRPMNAFMLFAKRYRLEITQKHPGKDNRAISVILGDQWKSLSQEDRKTYISEAKVLADEHKRIYPDCWKRKRTSKVPSTTKRKS